MVIGDVNYRRVRRVALDGTITTIAGNGGFSAPTVDSAVALDTAITPVGLAIDAQGDLLVADRDADRLRRIDSAGMMTTVAGTGVPGFNGDAGPAITAQMDGVWGVSVDATGRILVAETTNRVIRRIELDGTIHTIAGRIDPTDVVTGAVARARLGNVEALAAAGAMTIAASGSSGTIEVMRNGIVEVVAGRYPQTTPTGVLARFRARSFGSIAGIAIDPATGVIYASETEAHRIHAITPVDPADSGTWTIETIVNQSGLPGSTNGAAATAGLRFPTGLLFEASTRTLYIADSGNSAIRTLALDTMTVAAFANVAGRYGFGGDGGDPGDALLFGPSAMTRCPNGDLFIADTGNNRIRRVAAGTITTVLGDGVAASSGEGSPSRDFPVNYPRGLACDAAGNLFVSSKTSVRLLLANAAGVVDGDGEVQTIYGAPPRTAFPASQTSCLTGLLVTSPTQVQVADSCTGLVVQLTRAAVP